MSRTFHHNKKRFHPFINPKSTEAGLRVFFARHPLRCGVYHCNYSSAGPKEWRHLTMEVPARAARTRLERAAALGPLEEDVDNVHWPLHRKPVVYYY